MAKKSNKFIGIDDAQIAAMLAFRALYGRSWKSQLLCAWMTGTDTSELGGSALRRLRNCSGPSWLDSLRPSELDAEATRRGITALER